MEDGKERCSNNAREMRNKQWGPKKKKKKKGITRGKTNDKIHTHKKKKKKQNRVTKGMQEM